MEITVRLFAMLRERAGSGELTLELADGARVADALAAVEDLVDGLPLVTAVNRHYAKPSARLSAGDELALIPPVSGGAAADAQEAGPADAPAPLVEVSAQPLSAERLSGEVADPRAGAVVVFQGVTREVERLEYEAYEEMAHERMRDIASAAQARHGLCRVAVAHRTGDVPLSEPSVVVAVSAPHREEAFAGAREIIDTIKAQAPIWKREVDGEASRWVPGQAPTS